MKLYLTRVIGCMASNFLLGFKENRATFDSSASLQNYISFERRLNEPGTSKVGFLNFSLLTFWAGKFFAWVWGAVL